MKEYIKLSTSNSININRIASLLSQNNIPTIIKDNVESARLAGFGISQNEVELYVYNSDFERAQQIINQFKKESNL